jgi:MFS family permease
MIQGIFAAMLVPQVLATFQATMQGERKTRALALYGATGGFAAVVGQIAGGVLVTANILGSSWRPIFLINVPIGIAVLVITRYVVPATRSDRPTGIDVPGTLAFAATLVALLIPLTEGNSLHWPLWSWALIAAAGVLGAVTLLIERRTERAGHTPLLPPSLLTLRSMACGLTMYLALSVGLGAFPFAFVLTVQDGLHADPLVGGLAVVPMAACSWSAPSSARRSSTGSAGQALGVAILGSLYLYLSSRGIPLGFATVIGVQLGISVLLALGSRLLPRFTGIAEPVARSAATPATSRSMASCAHLAAAASTMACAWSASLSVRSMRCRTGPQ